ncbi:recombinase RecT [Anaerovibrio sp. RM50]|uniref:recombinase RecT n=1 Tax=Anaerovibrio sp. RM50 TaxID=1200557 RepID=UPI0006880899|nr:recombinase RecT [Anaerovibrio sp. RM50]
MKNEVANVNTGAVQQVEPIKTIDNYLTNSLAREKFEQVLDKGANGFIVSLTSLVKSDNMLAQANPKTIMSAAMTAATLKLPINPSLGLAYIIPYRHKDKNGNYVVDAQFQMGYKGFVQLAERTGQYRTINATVIREGEIEDIDIITGEIKRGKRKSDKVVGYAAYIKFVNGFEKTLYMTKEDMTAHAKKYSQSFQKGFGPWKDNFDAMAQKTVLKQLISKYGIMSIDMQSSDMAMALASDQAVVSDACGTPSYDYIDNRPSGAVEDVSFGDEPSVPVQPVQNVHPVEQVQTPPPVQQSAPPVAEAPVNRQMAPSDDEPAF